MYAQSRHSIVAMVRRSALPLCLSLVWLAAGCADDVTGGGEGEDAPLETEESVEPETDATEAGETEDDSKGETTDDASTSTSGDGDGDSAGDGDGDPASGDGDGDDLDPLTSTSGDGDGDGDGDADTGDGDGDTDPLEEIPEEEFEPIAVADGVPSPLPGVYTDLGPADPDDEIRSLLGLRLRDRQALDDFLYEVADPSSDIFGQYLTRDEFMQEHAPLPEDVELLAAWLESVGFEVRNIASSGMLIHYWGTVGAFNEAYNTELHLCERTNPQFGGSPFNVYCATGFMTLPIFVQQRSTGVTAVDLRASTDDLSNEAGSILLDPPANPDLGLIPTRMADTYGLTQLWDQGYDGSGEAVAVITGSRPHYKWLQTFWQSFGILRPNPVVVPLLEPAAIRTIEATLNPAWAGAMAPGAEIIQYAGPDARNCSIEYVYNEAIWRMPEDGARVLTTSFAHREDAEPTTVRNTYDDAAAMGAAMGLTLMGASGNSSKPDIPSSSPYSMAVGGTRVYFDNQNEFLAEISWDGSGSGITKSFPRPPWQDEVAGNISDKHVVVDLALAAAPFIGSAYWIFWLGEWELYGGTSFAAPAFSGMCAVMDQYRAENGLPPLGFLPPKLYWDDDVNTDGFRDITVGGTPDFDAGFGWDPPSGFGAPRVDVLAEIVP